MKIKFSLSEYLLVAVVVGAIAYGTNWGTSAMMWLRSLFPRSPTSVEAPKPRVSLPPLAKQIPLCRKDGPGFQACMFRAGYAVNSAWTSAHNADRAGPATALDGGRATEVINDPYRAGPSPAYGVPYWVPRQP